MRVNIIQANRGGFVVEVIDERTGPRLELYDTLAEVVGRLNQVFVLPE